MKNVVWAFAAVFLAACAARTEVEPITRVVADLRGQLQPVNESGIVGAAAARTGWGQTGVSVSINGADSGAQHPWHIHRGTCGSGGPIVGDAAAYPVLSVGGNARASASATLGVELTRGTSYYVNIHQSPTQLGTIVACGPLSF